MNEQIKLSKRLQTIASFISPNSFFADIGSDHAYLPCYICLNDQTVRAIAGEVRKGPFLRAKETVATHHLTDRIEVRLGDGLQVIGDNPINEIVIAGMGGSLIASIINAGIDKLATVKRLIIQPNTNAAIVRKTFLKHHFTLTQEVILEENDHIYEVLVAERNGKSVYQPAWNFEKQLMFGPKLMQEKSPIFINKWQDEQEKLSHVVQRMKQAKNIDMEKLDLFERQLQWIEEVLS